MPPRKFEWSDTPNTDVIKDKDPLGKWIKCKVCNLTIKVRAQYGHTEWEHHCSSSKHCTLLRNNLLLANTKITNFFGSSNIDDCEITPSLNNDVNYRSPKKTKLTPRCPGFSYGKNTDLLPLYDKYQKLDDVSKKNFIQCISGKWSIHSIDCTKEAVSHRKSQRLDKKACENCFSFPLRVVIKDRIKRMEKISRIEQYLSETSCSDTGFIFVCKFIKNNTATASPSILLLIERCKQYLAHHQWMKENFSKLQVYNVVDQHGKIHNETWLNQFARIYSEEPSMKDTLLHALIQFTLSRYNGNVNAPASPKLIAFFQTLHAYSPRLYSFFSKNLGGYNERTLRRMSVKNSAEIPIIDCSLESIQTRSKKWIEQLRIYEDTTDTIVVSAMADATKVPPIGEYSVKYHAWVGGQYPNHYIDDEDYNQEKFIESDMATEIKVALLSTQTSRNGCSPFKIICARPQSTNEVSDEYNNSILHSVDGIPNVQCVSIAFDGLASESRFIRNNLVSFMNGSSQTVAMTDCNHAAKNMRSQLVLGSSVVTGGEGFFDVGILMLAGVQKELYCVTDYASDVVVLKLCSSDTIAKLLSLIEQGSEDSKNIAFMALSLYFLNTFLCAYNTPNISSEGRVTMLWSSLMWFTSLSGINEKSQHNFVTSCLGGVFLSMQKKVKNLRLTTTEPLEHTFGTIRSWKREFTVGEFISYSNKLEIVMHNAIENGILSGTSSKGYMTGFKGFADVVRNIKMKLSKGADEENGIDISIDIDYSLPVSGQIEKKLIEVVSRTQAPILRIMRLFGINEISPYCYRIHSMKDICNMYQKISRILISEASLLGNEVGKQSYHEQTIVQQLANLAIEFNAEANLTDMATNIERDEWDSVKCVTENERMNLEVKFDCDKFYNFIRYNMRNENVGKMLHLMKESIDSSRDKNKIVGSVTDLQKVKSLNGRWFQRTKENIEDFSDNNSLERDCIYEKNGRYYRVLSIFKKSYGKWRHVRSGNINEKLKIHIQELNFYQMGFSPEPHYSLTTSMEIGHYIGHSIEPVY